MELGGRPLSIETGKFAKQANASVIVRYAETAVLVTVCMSKDRREGVDYLPLMVDYDEKMYASGKIKGSRFVKREGRPSDEAQLTARLIDRPLRPLFDESIREDMQIVITTLSYDGENNPDIPAMIGAATALMISDIPFDGPVAGVRVGMVDGELTLNPIEEEMEKSPFDLIVAGSSKSIIMVESGANQVSEEEILKAMEFGHKHIREIVELQEKIAKAVGKPKMELPELKKVEHDKALVLKIDKLVKDEISKLLLVNNKQERNKLAEELLKKVLAELKPDFDDKIAENSVKAIEEKEEQKREFESAIKEIFDELLYKKVRDDIMINEKRIGGRKLDEIRPLDIEVGLFKRTHGTGLFQRGETQVLSVSTLGAPGEEQIVDSMEEEYKKRFIHHYNMPAFATGETKPSRWPSRRELGHGAIVERALTPVLPDKEKFPYTIRVVSEVLEANGSTSMASTCGAALALMDAGVPITNPIAGIAMGLVTDGKGGYKILTDIQGEEDHLGDMDFKVTGSEKGVTCMQMDIKVKGIAPEVFSKALEQAKKARLEILSAMKKVIAEPRKELSPHAPRIVSFKINPEKIRDVIGKGGETINKIIDEHDVKIDIEDDGLVMVSSKDENGIKDAVAIIKNIVRVPEIGELFKGKVVRIENFGAFVNILPGKDGLVHISELAPYRVNKVEDIIKLGDEIDVIVSEIDAEGRINLSKKLADTKLGKKVVPPKGYKFEKPSFSPRKPFRRPFRGGGNRNRFNQR